MSLGQNVAQQSPHFKQSLFHITHFGI